jgi:hypothetical protein
MSWLAAGAVVGAVIGVVTGSFAPSVYDTIGERDTRFQVKLGIKPPGADSAKVTASNT